nr:MAG TPA: hypothetical protein [Caudoviricetes sp.]
MTVCDTRGKKKHHVCPGAGERTRPTRESPGHDRHRTV